MKRLAAAFIAVIAFAAVAPAVAQPVNNVGRGQGVAKVGAGKGGFAKNGGQKSFGARGQRGFANQGRGRGFANQGRGRGFRTGAGVAAGIGALGVAGALIGAAASEPQPRYYEPQPRYYEPPPGYYRRPAYVGPGYYEE